MWRKKVKKALTIAKTWEEEFQMGHLIIMIIELINPITSKISSE